MSIHWVRSVHCPVVFLDTPGFECMDSENILQKIFLYVPQKKESRASLERHEGE